MHAKTIIPQFFINIDKIICYVYYLDANVYMFAYARLRNLFKIQWLTTFKKQEKNDYQCWEKTRQITPSPVYLGVSKPPKKRQNMAKNSRSIKKILYTLDTLIKNIDLTSANMGMRDIAFVNYKLETWL